MSDLKSPALSTPSSESATESPVIEITPCGDKSYGLPLRPSLDVIFTYPTSEAEDVFEKNAAEEVSNSEDTVGEVKADVEEDEIYQGLRKRFGGIKTALKDLSPKIRRRKMSKLGSLDSSDHLSGARMKRASYAASMQYGMFSASADNTLERDYVNDTEKFPNKHRRHYSLGSLMKDDQANKLTRKTGLITSVRNLFSASKTSITKDVLLNSSSLDVRHIRQSSDSLILDMKASPNALDGLDGRRRSTLDNEYIKNRKATKARKSSNKEFITIDSSGMELCLIPIGLVGLDPYYLPEFEVRMIQRIGCQ